MTAFKQIQCFGRWVFNISFLFQTASRAWQHFEAIKMKSRFRTSWRKQIFFLRFINVFLICIYMGYNCRTCTARVHGCVVGSIQDWRKHSVNGSDDQDSLPFEVLLCAPGLSMQFEKYSFWIGLKYFFVLDLLINVSPLKKNGSINFVSCRQSSCNCQIIHRFMIRERKKNKYLKHCYDYNLRNGK